MKKTEFKIGDKIYKSKSEALSFYKSILDKYTPPESVSDEDYYLLIDLINHNPDEIISDPEKLDDAENNEPMTVNDIYVEYHPVYKKTKCFFADLGEEQWLFSYRLMINGDLSEEQKFYIACRNAVKNDLHSFKERVFSNKPVRCALTNQEVSWDDCQIDHKPPLTFSVIVRTFYENRKIENVFDHIDYEGKIWKFINFEMEKDFVDFHKNIAVLRTLSKSENLKTAKNARIKPTKNDYKL